MVEAPFAVRPFKRVQFGRILAYGLWLTLALHAIVVLALRANPVAASRYCTAAVPLLAGVCCLWRAVRLPVRERPMWRWASAGLLLWGLAHTVETVLGNSMAASNLAVDPSDFIYVAATFPLLLALSTTRETESLRAVFALNCAQIVLALILSYVLLYQMSMTPEAASTVMGRIYGTACVLLAIMAFLRVLTWATREERQGIRWMCVVLWTYLPIELGMDYASARWNLRAGTLIDLLWSVPFFIGGWQALHLPVNAEPEPRKLLGRKRLLVEALCPMLITAGIFALAASITRQHLVLGLTAIFLLLAIQGFQAAVVQLNYLAGRNRLMEQEQDLRIANAKLEALSLQDPLTGIANRRRFNDALENAWRRAIRRRQPLSLLIIDVDFFKGVNDLHGHLYGDECLITIARALGLHARRPDDVVARIGGEEFVFLLPDTDKNGADLVADQVHEAIRLMAVVNDASPFDNRLTISIGIGVSYPRAGMDMAGLVDCADQALYDAKGLGRNRTQTRILG
jgi:diguanylate cyclase (GGDEF)-like protein